MLICIKKGIFKLHQTIFDSIIVYQQTKMSEILPLISASSEQLARLAHPPNSPNRHRSAPLPLRHLTASDHQPERCHLDFERLDFSWVRPRRLQVARRGSALGWHGH